MRTSEKVDKILPALIKVKSKLQAVSKSANNPFFKSKYADLNTYLDEVEQHLELNELVLFQPVSVNESGANVVESIIMDSTGQFVASQMTVVSKEADMQKLGSAITYARRYTLGALLAMKAEDDDGNHASGKTDKPRAAAPATPSAQQVVSVIADSKPAVAEAPKAAARPSFRRPTKAAAPAAAPTETIESSGDDL